MEFRRMDVVSLVGFCTEPFDRSARVPPAELTRRATNCLLDLTCMSPGYR